MVLATASNITKSYGFDAILENISFNINDSDKIGLVGPNGAGKTTLMKILAGEENYSSGDLFLSNNLSIGYLKQTENAFTTQTLYDEMLSVFSDVILLEDDIRKQEETIARLSEQGEDTTKLLKQYTQMTDQFNALEGYSYKSKVKGVLNGLSFGQNDYFREISGLSGGEKTRLSLGKILLKHPNILMLDEPTNHLDMSALSWLEQYLKAYDGTLLIISHDRYFLDQTVSRVFEIENKTLKAFTGNYSTYTKKKEQQYKNDLKAFENQAKEIKKQEELIRKFKERGTEKLAKRARSREKRLDSVDVLDKPTTFNERAKIKFSPQIQSGKDVLYFDELSKSFGDKSIIKPSSFDLKRSEKVCIVGPNGCGKSTLLKLILSILPPDTGYIKLGSNVNIGYFDQEQKMLNEENSLIEEIHNEHPAFTDTKVRSVLGSFLFTNDDVFKKVSVLSGGEKVKLSLLKLMLSKSNFLIMDEPTNHLDITSKEIIEEALSTYEGTLLIVSHDRYFLNKIPSRIIEIEDGKVVEYLGNYDYFVEKKKALQEDAVEVVEESVNKTHQKILRKKEKERQSEERKLKKAIQTIESAINQTEEDIEKIHEALCLEEIFSSPEKSLEYNQKLSECTEKLEDLYAQWETYHES